MGRSTLAHLEPITTQAILDYKAVNFHPAAVQREVINPYPAGVWLLSQQYLEKQPEKSRKFVEAFEGALDFMRKNPAKQRRRHSLHQYCPTRRRQDGNHVILEGGRG